MRRPSLWLCQPCDYAFVGDHKAEASNPHLVSVPGDFLPPRALSKAPTSFRRVEFGRSSLHLDVALAVGGLDPQHVVAPDQDLAQVAGELLVDELLRVGELDVHVAVGRHQPALVLGLAPLQAHDDVLVDPVEKASRQHQIARGVREASQSRGRRDAKGLLRWRAGQRKRTGLAA